MLSFWGVPNLQVINPDAHAAKCLAEAHARRGLREELKPADLAIISPEPRWDSHSRAID